MLCVRCFQKIEKRNNKQCSQHSQDYIIKGNCVLCDVKHFTILILNLRENKSCKIWSKNNILASSWISQLIPKNFFSYFSNKCLVCLNIIDHHYYTSRSHHRAYFSHFTRITSKSIFQWNKVWTTQMLKTWRWKLNVRY